MDVAQKPWHAISVDEAFTALDSKHTGLSPEEAARRLEVHGPNEILAVGGISKLAIILAQIKNPLIYILGLAAIVSLLAGHPTDAFVILGVVVLNTTIGFVQEYKAEEALEALKKRAAPEADVLRDCPDEGCIDLTIPARELVPGDIVVLRDGDQVPADLRLYMAANLDIDESMLTGESVAVSKDVAPVPEDRDVAERPPMAYGGTNVVRGRGRGIVVSTGQHTQMGQIATLLQETEKAASPLQERTLDLSKRMGGIAAAMSVLVLAIGLLVGFRFDVIFMLALAAAVSAIPEGLPAVMTITLAVGVHRMAQRNAIIRKLQAVDTLGAATVICTDKTGTLTTNEMTVQELLVAGDVVRVSGAGWAPHGEFSRNGSTLEVQPEGPLHMALVVGALCNDSRLSTHDTDNGHHWQVRGDPTEAALVVAAAKAGLHKEVLDEETARIDEIPFSSQTKYMATFHEVAGGKVIAYVKGAPETVLSMCSEAHGAAAVTPLDDQDREEILEHNQRMASQALRVLGLAYREAPAGDLAAFKEELEYGRAKLVFAGLTGMMDPPRPEVVLAVRQCHQAGVRVIMLTGDHKLTGEAIAREVGILSDGKGTVLTGQEVEAMSDGQLDEVLRDAVAFARVSPEHKHRIVEALNRQGEVVAMTGDGVNDAPALQASAIGVAMGITGTDVTKGVADMVLADDNFASIVSAVEEGRAVFENVRKVVKFLLATNVGEMLTILGSLLLLPVGQTIFTPLQILWVNLVTDGVLDITIALEPKEGDVMREPPRPRGENIINRSIVQNIVLVAVFMAVGTLWMYLSDVEAHGVAHAQTMAFVTLAMFQVFNSLNVRSRTQSLFKIGVFTNKYLIAAIVVSITLQVAATRLPFMQSLFGTVALSLTDWLTIFGVSSSVFVADELRKWVQARNRGPTAEATAEA